jgi:nucleotide-binding universal stress UspA family protein
MYQKIVVPLDGSELSECVLPHLETIYKGCEVKEALLVHTIEPLRYQAMGDYAFSENDLKKMDERRRNEAQTYLDGIAGNLAKSGINARTVILAGNPADTIAEYAEKNGADLVLVATHGRSGISRWAWGSVADRILRSACVPVLMVRAPGCVPGI